MSPLFSAEHLGILEAEGVTMSLAEVIPSKLSKSLITLITLKQDVPSTVNIPALESITYHEQHVCLVPTLLYIWSETVCIMIGIITIDKIKIVNNHRQW